MSETPPEKRNEALPAAPHPVYQPPTAETLLPEGTILRSPLAKIVQRNLRYFRGLSDRADQALQGLGMSPPETAAGVTSANPAEPVLAGEDLFKASAQTDHLGRPLLPRRTPLARLRQLRQADLRENTADDPLIPQVMIESPFFAKGPFLTASNTWAAIRRARQGLPAVSTGRTPGPQPDFTGNSQLPTTPTPIVHEGLLPQPEATLATEQLPPLLPEAPVESNPVSPPPARATHTYEVPVEAILGYKPGA